MSNFEDPQLSSENLSWYLQEIAKISKLTPDEEKVLGRRIQDGDKAALTRLVEANLRFVVSFAKRYRGLGLSFLDLLNEGNLGLIEAAKRYDPDKNVKFITYAVWWIRQAIIHALAEQSGAFRLPQKQASLAYQINKKSKQMLQKLEREPSVSELADEMHLSEDEVRKLLQVSSDNISLSGAIDDEGEYQLEDKLEQVAVAAADDQLLQEAFEVQMHQILEELDDKEALVIRQRFGLTGEEPKTLKEIGEMLNLSRERVRQIEAIGLKKLRRNPAMKELRSYLS